MTVSMRIVSKGYFKSIQQFHIDKENPLGVGSFGTVRLGLHIKTNKMYAIKIVDINDGLSQSQIKILQREIFIHSSLDHPHVIKLWDTIRQDSHIFLILQCAGNGSLFHFQNLHTKFVEPDAYKYFYQTLDALKYLHQQNIMHRDIKPQNLLLDSENNIKICDFGWATENIHQKRNTFCGTYEYMAPQMVYEKQYDYKIDIWALGILLYELVHGVAPFKAKSLEDIKQKISKGSYEISNSCSKQLKHLIMTILQFQPQDRPTLQQISTHQWVTKMPHIANKQILTQFKQRSQKKINRKISTEDILKINNYLVGKHKKYQSTDFQNMMKTNLINPDGKIHFNNSKKQQQAYKKALKKKCKTQGEEVIEKLAPNSDAKLFSHLTATNMTKFQNSLKKFNAKQNYLSNKVQTVESFRPDEMMNSIGATCKMRKLQQKISQLTNKYVNDKKKVTKFKNSKPIA